jgi:NADH-quinone oxidoreductase subunit K
MDRTQLLLTLSIALFAIGLLGVMIRRNVTFASQSATVSGAVLVFLVFVVAAAEIAIAIPIVLLLSRRRHTLDVSAYSELKG